MYLIRLYVQLERARVKNRFPRFGAPIPLMDGFLHDNVFEVGLVAIVAKWDVPDMLYWMSRVITCLDITGSFGCM